MRRVKPNVGTGIIPLSVADMEFRNAPEIIEGLKEYLDATLLGYPDPAFEPFLASVVGWMRRRHGWEIDPDWICGSPGVVDGVYRAIQAFTRPGEGVILQTPVYYPFYDAIRRNDRIVVRNQLVRRGTRYEIDFDDLEERAADPKVTALLFCSPHNPAARVWTRTELEHVAEICLRHDVIAISDEIHFDLTMPGHRHTVFANLSPEVASRSVVCAAPSKTFNLAGLKTSHIIIPDARLRARFIEQGNRNGFHSLNLLGYKASEIAYNHGEAWLEELLRVIRRNHAALREFMADRLPGIVPFDLEGTYLQWMDFSGLGMDRERLRHVLVDAAEVFLDDGAMFGPEGEGYQRMNLACPTAALMAALDRLASALKRA